MSNWIDIKVRTPELIIDEYGAVESDEVPVIIEGIEGWHKGKFRHSYGEYSWMTIGFSGNFKVTHWYELPCLD